MAFSLTVASPAESLTQRSMQALDRRCPRQNCNGRERERRERKGEDVTRYRIFAVVHQLVFLYIRRPKQPNVSENKNCCGAGRCFKKESNLDNWFFRLPRGFSYVKLPQANTS